MQSPKEQFYPFSGDLAKDSPSASFLIERIFDQTAYVRLAHSYSLVLKDCPSLEQRIIRSPGVRFNPLPARIIYILIAEGKCTDLEIIDAAILACAKVQLYSLRYIASLNNNIISKSPYIAAFALDLLRHLHMSLDKEDPDLRAQLIAINELTESAAFSYWPKINSLITSALARCNKIIKD